jgi:hypothetical protein
MALIRLFNEPAGLAFLRSRGVPADVVEQLPLMGISSAANVIMAIKMARYYELTEKDVIFTVSTDSMEMYGSRLREKGRNTQLPLNRRRSGFQSQHPRLSTDWMKELTYYDRKTYT